LTSRYKHVPLYIGEMIIMLDNVCILHIFIVG